MSERATRVILEEMLESAQAIQEYASGLTLDEFRSQRMAQDAVIRRIEILGEAARSLPAEFTQQHPAVPWPQVVAMRNRLIHGYFSVDLDLTWTVVQRDIPELERILHALLDQAL
jgi:uncharacterized protein with HEPN domain